ncbi:S1 RNA-binding domain-containing protein [Streptomyces phyllanthi]|uniref:S1 RNA-binding domain-containing protein n=1 Tax=Streptomyces phyllanthi TaxID=1803180 RepID=A0A5N8WB37_9ACTN|nr:S1 RNA-binding domain-containing protein [Streptomyces phyllanthi]MPY44016.1 S1 RNA-binding domain-containing protein [Streptomyces phyllanthi]
MGESSEEQECRGFLASLSVGDLCGGIVAEVVRSGAAVTLDGFAARPLGVVGTLDLTWRRRRDAVVEVGLRITAEVMAVDLDGYRVLLSTAATENPELWAFLKGLRWGEILSGTVAAIESYGVFVALDDGPGHPVFPGVGFITYPELSWRHFESASDIVAVGQRVACEFLQFDTTNGEARLSLRATRPDPFQAFADGVAVGRTLRGQVTKLVPFGVFVEVADGVEGLVHVSEPVDAPEDVVRVGDQVQVVVTEIDRERRRLVLSRRQVPPGLR